MPAPRDDDSLLREWQQGDDTAGTDTALLERRRAELQRLAARLQVLAEANLSLPPPLGGS